MKTIQVDEHITLKLVDHERDSLSRWFSWPERLKGIENYSEYIKVTQFLYERKLAAAYVIHVNKKVVGSIGFNQIDIEAQSAQLAFWLSERFYGQGIMTRSCKALIEHAVYYYSIYAFEVLVNSENTKR
ncbi:GNAT family N-acetyltransferase [Reinekea sp.]|jgi:ribosomal-protein-serine acetyltransferase|uniref:GNAT family N-acetyltransferase n=1 Tax=Reinekea sp. TaxID=1970455 RepID=UPI003989FD22